MCPNSQVSFREPGRGPADGLPHDAVGNGRRRRLLTLTQYPKEISGLFRGHPEAVYQNADGLIDHRAVGQHRPRRGCW